MNTLKVLSKGFIDFHRGVLKMSILWKLWLVLLVAANLVVPLLFLGRVEAQVVLVAFLGAFLLMVVLTGYTGFTRLLGLGHLVFWTPAVVYLFTRLDHVPPEDFFEIWLRVLLTVNVLSLIIDAVDVIRYAAGDHSDTVAGLRGDNDLPQEDPA